MKKDFVLSQVGDSYVVVPVGGQYEKFKGVIQLNHTGAVIWEGLEAGMSREEIADSLLERFRGVDRQTALASVDHVVQVLREECIFEEEADE